MNHDFSKADTGESPRGSLNKCLSQASHWRWSVLVLTAALLLPSAQFVFNNETKQVSQIPRAAVSFEATGKRPMLTWAEAKRQARELERTQQRRLSAAANGGFVQSFENGYKIDGEVVVRFAVPSTGAKKDESRPARKQTGIVVIFE